MESHPKLDVALAYLANCQNLSKEVLETVPIEDPIAMAIQNIAVAKKSRFPQMSGRLIATITSATSRKRFLNAGFDWKAVDSSEN